MARPRIEIDWSDFDKLCSIHCTLNEFAAWFRCSTDSIERAVLREKKMSFADYFVQKSGPGKISLRRKQWDLALKGDKTMIIWLGKQHLDQSDKEHKTINAQVESKETITLTTSWREIPKDEGKS